jgi:hypothetical protein
MVGLESIIVNELFTRASEKGGSARSLNYETWISVFFYRLVDVRLPFRLIEGRSLRARFFVVNRVFPS